MLHQLKAQQFYNDLGSISTVQSPTVNSRIQGLFKALSGFPVLFKSVLIFKDFSRKPSKFKYFSSLCKPKLLSSRELKIATLVEVKL